MSYKWNWGIFFQLSPDGTYTYLQLLLFGAGWTLACGSGACAAVAVLQQRGDVDANVQVDLPGGALQIARSSAGRVWMTGPAAFVFEGEWPVPPPAR